MWHHCYDANTSLYFENHNQAMVIALDEVDRLFAYPQVASEFFGLLRSWHEEGKNATSVWHKLRLILVHSREVYSSLNAHQSPFNVGMGLVVRDKNAVRPSCDLYKHYFQHVKALQSIGYDYS